MGCAWGNEWVDGKREEGFEGERNGPRRVERGGEIVGRKREFLELEEQR